MKKLHAKYFGKTISRAAGFASVSVLVFCSFLNVGTLAAKSGLEITDVVAKGQFPLTVTFSMQASGPYEISDVRLNYTVEHDSFVDVISEVSPTFSPSTEVNASWTMDMRQSGGLPPGAELNYWWMVEDTSGGMVVTQPVTYSFNDSRFNWISKAQGNLVFNWYGSSKDAAQSLLTSSIQGLAELQDKTGAGLSRPVQVYVYANTSDMLGAMIFPQEWTGAATYSDFSTIIIGLSGDNTWNTNTMIHELAHVVSYQLSRNPYSGMPIWLNEGFSMYAEGSLDLYFSSALTSALNDGTTITVRSLSSPFSADPALSYLSYAESYSIIDYLVSTFGQSKILSLLESFHSGIGYDAALMEVYGFDMDELYSQWFKYAVKAYVGAVVP
jgi:hypothetical protein